MNQFHKLFRWAWSILVVCTLAFAMGGCEGDDGAQGPAGPTGPAGTPGADGADGPPGPGAEITPLESCAVCHSEGSFASAPAAHAVDPIEVVSAVDIAPIVDSDDLLVTFTIERGGVLTAGYGAIEGFRSDGTTQTPLVLGALTDNGDGSYSLVITDGGLAAGNNRYLFLVGIEPDVSTNVAFYHDYPASPFEVPLAVSAQSCTACHGPEGIAVHESFDWDFQAQDGGEPCLTCHGSFGFGFDIPPLFEVAHAYHSNVWDPEEHITYPTYMSNCSVCHSDEIAFGEGTELDAANAMGVSRAGCLSCHGAMDNDDWDFSGGLGFHLTAPEDVNCASADCHSPTGAANLYVNVPDFHNYGGTGIGIRTERGGFIFDGVDTSVEEGELFAWTIDNIVDDGVDLTITWSASYGGVGVDPCNADINAGPVFFNGNQMRAYRSYAQGGDFILGQAASPAGAPANVELTVDNTTCALGVATTVLAVDDVDATLGRVVFGGKPQVLSDLLEPATQVAARVPSPAYDWLVGDGEQMERRGVVDNSACLGCHVGSMYQHGGDRVDNVDMCLMCHNAASNEQNVRVAMGVDASEAYDGKVGETYELKTMLHRIHSSNFNFADRGEPPVYNPPYLVYRGRGIYAFAAEGDIPPNWDPTNVDGCDAAEIADGKSRVFGSDPDATDACEVHNYHNPTFPRNVNECTACHVEGFAVIPDQAVAMANTIEVGGTDDYSNQLDDVLQGAATTACVTCHYNSAARGHAYQNSWTPQDFPMGRQSIIDAAN